MNESRREPVVIGRVSGVFGTRGWLKVQSFTRPAERIVDYAPWLLRSDDGWQEVRLRESRRHHGALIVALEGIDNRDQAAGLVRCEIAAWRERFAPAEPGEFYWVDLVGLRVFNRDEVCLGDVRGLLETAAHDVLRVVAADGRERLIPFVRDVYVLDVDIAGGTIGVDWHVDD
jgi:16S rRNA processing protein RimM